QLEQQLEVQRGHVELARVHLELHRRPELAGVLRLREEAAILILRLLEKLLEGLLFFQDLLLVLGQHPGSRQREQSCRDQTPQTEKGTNELQKRSQEMPPHVRDGNAWCQVKLLWLTESDRRRFRGGG